MELRDLEQQRRLIQEEVAVSNGKLSGLRDDETRLTLDLERLRTSLEQVGVFILYIILIHVFNRIF